MKKKKITLCSVSVLLSEVHFLGKLLCPLTLDTGTKVAWLCYLIAVENPGKNIV